MRSELLNVTSDVLNIAVHPLATLLQYQNSA